MDGKHTKNNSLIYQALHNAFPNDANALLKLCNHGLDQPLGSEHPLIIQDLIGKKIPDDIFEKIKVGYVMITAYYFLLDAVVDDHLPNKLNSLYLTHLMSLACQNFSEVLYLNGNTNHKSFNDIFHKLISENAKAIRSENEFAVNPYIYSDDLEYDSIVGRSNSALILLHLIAIITNTEDIEELKDFINDFAFFVQLGDDLADWREDFTSKKYTSFLRELFSKYNKIMTETELEEAIYLTDTFEARALKVIKGLTGIINRIEKRHSENGRQLILIIKFQIEKMKTLMTQIIEIKLLAKND